MKMKSWVILKRSVLWFLLLLNPFCAISSKAENSYWLPITDWVNINSLLNDRSNVSKRIHIRNRFKRKQYRFIERVTGSESGNRISLYRVVRRNSQTEFHFVPTWQESFYNNKRLAIFETAKENDKWKFLCHNFPKRPYWIFYGNAESLRLIKNGSPTITTFLGDSTGIMAVREFLGQIDRERKKQQSNAHNIKFWTIFPADGMVSKTQSRNLKGGWMWDSGMIDFDVSEDGDNWYHLFGECDCHNGFARYIDFLRRTF